MPESSDEQYAIQQLILINAINYCAVATTALVGYDWLLSMATEVKVVWTWKLTLSSAVYVLTRYPILLFVALDWVPFTYSEAGCRGLMIVTAITNVVLVSMPGVFGALRVYAVSGRDWRPTLLTLALGLCPGATNVYNLVTSRYGAEILADGTYQCFSEQKSPVSLLSKIIPRLLILSRACVIACDTVVILSMWLYTRSHRRFIAQAMQKSSLVILMLRDGMMLFVFILILNIVDIVIWLVKSFNINLVITSPVTMVLISRCLLNMRDIIEPPADTSDLPTLHLSFAMQRTESTAAPSHGLISPTESTISPPQADTLLAVAAPAGAAVEHTSAKGKPSGWLYERGRTGSATESIDPLQVQVFATSEV
ncbi:uncharacterized protein C8Q71DRAFT_906584 [Rhodofomes roseus]|uniref:DUF6533 domain-containing protein n=1 Tax=Rhodofomes roseus TaxID=34475 RepID=A0ABQ8KHV8_9APHY|nr:uncharacterized protein C8Q71DRAFT_906584 [Rhodofomes roseus]KAH9837575.1 hypothetical protein C8Q71DRAFT_906584 [Rhodofomes roseus]